MQMPALDTSGTDLSETQALGLRRAICAGFFINSCVSNGTPQAGYTVAKLTQPVLVHPGSTLALASAAPQWVVYIELAKTSRLFVRGLTCVERSWIELASRKFAEDAHLARLEDQVATAGEWVAVGPGLLGALIGRRGANLTKLEAELQATLEIEPGAGRCRLWCQRARLNEAQRGFAEHIRGLREEAVSETAEAVVCGATRVLVRAGVEAELVLLCGMYTRAMVRGVAADFDWDALAARAAFTRHGGGGRVRSVRCLGKASDERSSWGVVEMVDVEAARRLVERLDGTKLEDFGGGELSVRPSFGGSSLSVGDLVVDLKETSIKVHWFVGEASGEGFVNFESDGYALMAADELLRSPLVIQGKTVTAEVNPKNPESLRLRGLPPTADEIAVLKAIQHKHLQGVIEPTAVKAKGQGSNAPPPVVVLRKAADVAPTEDTAFDAAMFLSLWTAIGPIESCLTFPPEPDARKPVWKGKAYIRFSSAIDAAQAVEEYNGKAGAFGTGMLHVEPDFSWTVNLAREVYDIMHQPLKDAEAKLNRDLQGRVSMSVVDKEGPKGVTIKVASLVHALLTAARSVLAPIISGHLVRGLDARQEAAVFDRAGRAHVDRIIKETKCDISLDRRTRHVRLFHPDAQVRGRAEERLLEYLRAAVQIDTKHVQLPPGGAPALIGPDSKGLLAIAEQTGATLELELRRRRVKLSGTEEAVDDAMRIVEGLLAPLRRKSSIGGGEPADGEDCGICFCEIESGEPVHQLVGCGHRFERKCLVLQLRSAVESKPPQLPVRCATCGENMSLRDITALLSTEHMLTLCKGALAKYVEEHPDELRWCPTAGCGQVSRLL
jgi:hypothetical protein